MFFALLFKIFSAIRHTFLKSFYQRAGTNSPPKNFDNDLNFTSFAHDFNILAHENLDKVKRKAFQLFETDAESFICPLSLLKKASSRTF